MGMALSRPVADSGGSQYNAASTRPQRQGVTVLEEMNQDVAELVDNVNDTWRHL